MTLPEDLKSETIQLVDCHDLDEFIEKHLGKKWSTLRNDENRHNGSYTTYCIGEWYDDDESEQVQKWLERPSLEDQWHIGDYEKEGEISTLMLLNELWRRGILPEETIHVHLWW